MNRANGGLFILPFLNWLDWVIDTYGLEIFIVVVNLTPFLVVWILSGGFWRLPRRRPRIPPRLKPIPAGQRISLQTDPASRRRGNHPMGDDSFAT